MDVVKHIRGVEVEFGGEEARGWLPPGAARPPRTPIRTVKLDIEILDDGDGFVLAWTGPSKDYCNDTWHESMDAALEEAKLRFGIDPGDWSAAPDPSPQTEGFAVLRSAGAMIQEYLATDSATRNRPLLDQLWKAIAPHDPRNYRGSGCMFQGIGSPPVGSSEADWLTALHVDPSDPLLSAALAIGKFASDDLETGDLLFDEDHVRQVLALVPASGERLIAVKVRRDGFVDTNAVLGFDVGYWGGDHFSTICDSIVMPTWHPPPPEDFEKLAEAVADLNEHLLFRTADAAAAFCARYKQFPWAETEGYPGEFAVIQLELVDDP